MPKRVSEPVRLCGSARRRLILGLLLLPACWGATATLIKILRSFSGSQIWIAPGTLALGAGYLLWIAIFFTLPAPARAYVFGHELTHAFWALLMGSRVHDMRVGEAGGRVSLTRANALVLLAPYFFPFYTLLVILAFLICSFFTDPLPGSRFWLAAIGFTWGFHLTFSLRCLFQHQPDIAACGHLFSYILIYLFNILGISLWTALVTGTDILDFFLLLYDHISASYLLTSASLLSLGEHVLAGFQD